MEFVHLFIGIVALVCLVVFAYVVTILCNFFLSKANVFRQRQGKKPLSDRMIAVLSIMSGLSILL